VHLTFVAVCRVSRDPFQIYSIWYGTYCGDDPLHRDKAKLGLVITTNTWIPRRTASVRTPAAGWSRQ